MAASQKPRPSLEELWAQLEALPCTVKGEILDGELYVHPRPRPRHARAIGYLGRHLGGAFDYDDDGPGGWWIVPEPGINLPGSPEVSPDLAGWRRTKMPALPPEGEPLRQVPDWVCEVLSPSNARYVDGHWMIRSACSNEAAVRLPPFEQLELPLGNLWGAPGV